VTTEGSRGGETDRFDTPRAACKIQQICKLLRHRAEFAFAFNAPAKRPLEWNKRDNKQEQAQQQAGTSVAAVRVRHQTKRPAEQFRPGAIREFQFPEYPDFRTRVNSRFRERIDNLPELLRPLPRQILAEGLPELAIVPERIRLGGLEPPPRGRFFREDVQLVPPVYLDPEVLRYLAACAAMRGVSLGELVNSC
jgi:hypothetical protein